MSLTKRPVFVLMVSILAVFIFMLGIGGCDSPDEDEAVVEETEEVEAVEEAEEAVEEAEEEVDTIEEADVDADAEAIDLDEWRNPTDLATLISLFEELEWSWATFEDGIETETFVINYSLVGTETVDGVETDLAAITFEDQQIRVWIDEQGNVAQAEIDGEVMPGEYADVMMDGMLMSLFWPFWTIDEFGVEDMITEPNPGVNWSEVSTEQVQFNGVGAEVTRMQLDLGPPATPEGEEASVVWEIADFGGDFQMLTEWSVEETEVEDFSFTMSVNKAVPR